MGDEKLLREIGGRIQQKRRELHLTQGGLAEKMEVSVQMISNLELGKKAIRPENLIKVCRELHVSSDYILTGSHPEWKDTEFGRALSSLNEKDQRIIEMLVNSLAEKH